MENLKIKLTLTELEFIVNRAKWILENDKQYCDTIVIEKRSETDSRLGNDIGTAWIRSSNENIEDGRITHFF